MEKYFSFFGGLISGAKRMFSGLKGGNRMVATAAVKRVFSSSVGGVGKVLGGLKGGNRMVAVAAVNRVFNGLVGGAGKVFGSLKGGNRTAVAVAICFAALGFAPGLRADPGEDGSSIGAMT
ncbi:MAG: hypothetical protein LBJ94_04135, partial [Puniceicoccales bacterium]|nr:hypothetical protein [Puniceicoccales bacterium]